MRIVRWCIAFALAAACLLPAQCSFAELTPERAAYYKERTQEWESALGSYMLWNYYDRAMFCKIYGRRPGDFLNDEGIQTTIPQFPPNDCLTYDEALFIAKEFLCDYNPRITEEYLSRLHTASAYYDFWADPQTTVTGTEHTQFWVIQFGEVSNQNYVTHCDAYIDALTGRVCHIHIGIDQSHTDDLSHLIEIDFP